jgi:methenyltetrahydromethanopterin cyclohydrolase
MADLATISIASDDRCVYPGPAVTVRTDHPVAACMASQYAGWRINSSDFFAMASGPMRAAAGREPLFDRIGHRESADIAVGVLESPTLPPGHICCEISASCGVKPHQLTLLVARTASQAGTVQVVARSVETALHKMLEIGVPLREVVSALGTAPLPPVAADDLVGIGRTNDAVLYGGRVTIWLRADDDILASQVAQIPSHASADYGRPFADIFERYGRDFYSIDPLLFSPALVTLVNLDSGRSFTSGEVRPDLLAESFFG